MKINTVLIISFFISIAYAGDCVSSYNKTGCEKVEFDIGSDMQIQQYQVIYDSDQDGVIDAIDNCKSTLPKLRVDDKGCALEVKKVEQEELILETEQELEKPTLNIYFEYASPKISETYDASIEEFAILLEEDTNVIAKIIGHSDSMGVNQQSLSLRRAEEVKSAFVKRGIDESRLELRAAGDSEPIAVNSSEVGRSENRRVEVIIEKEGI